MSELCIDTNNVAAALNENEYNLFYELFKKVDSYEEQNTGRNSFYGLAAKAGSKVQFSMIELCKTPMNFVNTFTRSEFMAASIGLTFEERLEVISFCEKKGYPMNEH